MSAGSRAPSISTCVMRFKRRTQTPSRQRLDKAVDLAVLARLLGRQADSLLRKELHVACTEHPSIMRQPPTKRLDFDVALDEIDHLYPESLVRVVSTRSVTTFKFNSSNR